MSQVPEAQTVQVAPQTQATREECVYILLVKKTRGRDKVVMQQQPSLDSDCQVFPKWFYRWLEVEPWNSDIRKLVYDELDRKGYVVLEVRGKRSIWLGRTEPNEPALYVYNPKIIG